VIRTLAGQTTSDENKSWYKMMNFPKPIMVLGPVLFSNMFVLGGLGVGEQSTAGLDVWHQVQN